MNNVELTDLTSTGLKALAKDIELSGRSNMNTETLRDKLTAMDLSEIDLSVYDQYEIEEEEVVVPKKVLSRRRSVSYKTKRRR